MASNDTQSKDKVSSQTRKMRGDDSKFIDETFEPKGEKNGIERIHEEQIFVKEIKEIVDPCLVIEGNFQKKTIFMLKKYRDAIAENPRQFLEPANDEDWFPCKWRIPQYDLNGEFLGFICRNKKCPLDLSAQYVTKGRRHLRIITKEDCWLCGEEIEKSRLGLKEPSTETIEVIEAHKEGLTPKEHKTQKEIFQTIRDQGFRLTDHHLKFILKEVRLETPRCKGTTTAAKIINVSRTTIHRVIKAYRELDPTLSLYKRFHGDRIFNETLDKADEKRDMMRRNPHLLDKDKIKMMLESPNYPERVKNRLKNLLGHEDEGQIDKASQ